MHCNRTSSGTKSYLIFFVCVGSPGSLFVGLHCRMYSNLGQISTYVLAIFELELVNQVILQ